ncbi:hypothetical protein Tco_1257295 [Tanacetum coccineum]
MPTLRTAEVNLEENKEALEINLDLLEERREQAAIREAKSKAKMEKILQLQSPNTGKGRIQVKRPGWKPASTDLERQQP